MVRLVELWYEKETNHTIFVKAMAFGYDVGLRACVVTERRSA